MIIYARCQHLLNGGRKITFVRRRLTLIETIWPKELALLEETIKPMQSFIIHTYKTPYAIQEGRWNTICHNFWKSPGFVSVGHCMQIWSSTAYGICKWWAEAVAMAIKCPGSCYTAPAVVIHEKGKTRAKGKGSAASPWATHGPDFEFFDPLQVTGRPLYCSLLVRWSMWANTIELVYFSYTEAHTHSTKVLPHLMRQK